MDYHHGTFDYGKPFKHFWKSPIENFATKSYIYRIFFTKKSYIYPIFLRKNPIFPIILDRNMSGHPAYLQSVIKCHMVRDNSVNRGALTSFLI